jgi:hypothetical protein
MIQLAILELESRNLINSMKTSNSDISSEDTKQHSRHANLSLSDIRSLVCFEKIESTKKERFFDELCDLLDESVQLNDIKKVIYWINNSWYFGFNLQ